AYTAKEAIRVALAAVPKQIISERVVYTILAENHGFEWRYNIPPVAIKYIAFANKKQGINGAIFEFIPESVLKQFQQVESTISKKKIASIFTTGFIKTIQNGKPTLSDKLVHTIRISHPEFDELKEQFISQVTLLTQQAIEEYSRGEIKLRE
ncbi:MAG: hypothetical protein KBD66_02335, partial [Candidatus Doudnabacteria bacterium]|nr:hypothetical protein [Candidatus Doudnabacteria bacterium]